MSDVRLLTKTEAAARLGVSERTIDRLVEDGKLRKHPLSKRPKFSSEDIDRFLSGEQPEEARGAGCNAAVDKHIAAS